MTNQEIYKRTLKFSMYQLGYDLMALLVSAAIIVGMFYLGDKANNHGLIGLAVGIVLGIIILLFILRYNGYTYKAAQIAMMTRAVTEGSLPDDVIGEGKKIVKGRFATIAGFFLATGIIKDIFNQLGRGLTRLGHAVGGDDGETVASVISMVIRVVVAYLCDCCLGWVFYRKDQTAPRATCEGAVLFFRQWKTQAKNMGRVFGMGIVSLLVIGGVFTGIFYVIASRFPVVFQDIAQAIVEVSAKSDKALPAFLTDPKMLALVAAAVGGVIIWSILHNVFVRPFVLTGVLRNYLEAGMKEMPTEASFAMLDSKSERFSKLHKELA